MCVAVSFNSDESELCVPMKRSSRVNPIRVNRIRIVLNKKHACF